MKAGGTMAECTTRTIKTDGYVTRALEAHLIAQTP